MSKVVVIKLTDADAASGGLSKDQYLLMLKNGLTALAGYDDYKSLLNTLIPSGVVGIKTNCLVRKFNSTPVNLTLALSELLIESGNIKENNIVVWERSSNELKRAGYTLNISSRGIRCFGTDTQSVGYSEGFHSYGEVNSLVTKILTELVDHSINLPVLKDHSIAGMSAGMKNMYGAINNPNKFHSTNCSPYCAHINNLTPIRDKHRLTILDAVKVQYNGGPGWVSEYVDYYNGILISDDPVAIDRIGLKILEHLRKQNGQKTLKETHREVKYLYSADQIGLGTYDVNEIELDVVNLDRSGHATRGVLYG
jgi:uncharacterized protein (DUF362 family)